MKDTFLEYIGCKNKDNTIKSAIKAIVRVHCQFFCCPYWLSFKECIFQNIFKHLKNIDQNHRYNKMKNWPTCVKEKNDHLYPNSLDIHVLLQILPKKVIFVSLHSLFLDGMGPYTNFYCNFLLIMLQGLQGSYFKQLIRICFEKM